MSGNGTSKLGSWTLMLALPLCCSAAVAQGCANNSDTTTSKKVKLNGKVTVQDQACSLKNVTVTIKRKENNGKEAIITDKTREDGTFSHLVRPITAKYTVSAELQGCYGEMQADLPKEDRSQTDPSKKNPWWIGTILLQRQADAPPNNPVNPDSQGTTPGTGEGSNNTTITGATGAGSGENNGPGINGGTNTGTAPQVPEHVVIPTPTPNTFTLAMPQPGAFWQIVQAVVIGVTLLVAGYFYFLSYKGNKQAKKTLLQLHGAISGLTTLADPAREPGPMAGAGAAIQESKTQAKPEDSVWTKTAANAPASPNAAAAARSMEEQPECPGATMHDPIEMDETPVSSKLEILGPPPEKYAPIAGPGKTPRSSHIMDVHQPILNSYQRTCSAPDWEQAIHEFENSHTCLRLSLINQSDVEVDASARPEFEESARGWFLGVDDHDCVLCFPYFRIDLIGEKSTFSTAFEYYGSSSLQVTEPARLQRQANHWILKERGQIESAS